ncbi:hypothetical protein BDF14DRAFT_1729657 [Spinellus fusiger]|nr:hypothetical protein BDF14DRAFT_1729657 [Spinellus fusiger]
MKRKSAQNNNLPTKRSSTATVYDDEERQACLAGRQAFSRQQFKEACDHFSRCLELNPHSLTALDCRSVTYERLGDFRKATADAITMVRQAPRAALGYLRLGKRLVLENKYPQAIRVYEQGQMCIDLSDPHYSMLDKVLSNTRLAWEKEQKKNDPIHILPYDVLDKIFFHLPFRQRIIGMSVSRGWYAFALGWSGMWRHLDFDTRKVHNATLVKYFGYTTGKYVKSLSMSGSHNKVEKVFKLLLQKDCHYIESLSITYSQIPRLFFVLLQLMGRHLTHLRLDYSEIDPTTVFSTVLTTCHHLSHFSYFCYDQNKTDTLPILPTPSTLSPLTHLQLAYSENTAINAHLTSILQHFSQLKRLIIYGSENNVNLTLQTIATHCPHLSLFRYKRIWNRQTVLPWEATEQAQEMHELSLFDAHELLDEGIMPLLHDHKETLQVLRLAKCGRTIQRVVYMLISSGLPNLRQLNLDSCLQLTGDGIKLLVEACSLLKILEVPCVLSVTNDVLYAMSLHPTLVHINIARCHSVTGLGVKYIVDGKHTTLQKLIVDGCQSISPDAIQYARKVLKPNVLVCDY